MIYTYDRVIHMYVLFSVKYIYIFLLETQLDSLNSQIYVYLKLYLIRTC